MSGQLMGKHPDPYIGGLGCSRTSPTIQGPPSTLPPMLGTWRTKSLSVCPGASGTPDAPEKGARVGHRVGGCPDLCIARRIRLFHRGKDIAPGASRRRGLLGRRMAGARRQQRHGQENQG